MSHSDEFAFMSTSLDNNDIDLSMRAPYIPMNENDDLPLLTEDLMWSAFSDELSLHKDIKEATALQQQQQQQLQIQIALQAQQCGNDAVEQMIIENAINESAKRMMFEPTSNLSTLLVTDIGDRKQQILSNGLQQQLEQNQQQKFEINCNDIVGCGNDTLNNTAMLNDNSTKTSQLNKNSNDDGIRSGTPTQQHIIGDSPKLEVIDSISDGCITTYTIQMFEDDVYSKNG